MAEFFRDERPEAPPDVGWGVDPDSGGTGGSGGGGGGTGGGGPGWGYGWGWDGGTGGGGPGYGWEGAVPPNLKHLKRNTGGRLLRDGSGRLLLGTLMCRQTPALMLYISGDPERKHSDCVLLKLSDGRPMRRELNPKEPPDVAARFYWPWAQCGEFVLAAKWQNGHYDIARISRVRMVIYGVDTGWRTLPLGRYVDFSHLVITNDYRVYVNGIRGSVG